MINSMGPTNAQITPFSVDSQQLQWECKSEKHTFTANSYYTVAMHVWYLHKTG